MDKAAETAPVVVDVDGDGKLELDANKTEQTLIDLVTLDHKLRDEGICLGDVLRQMAASLRGINV